MALIWYGLRVFALASLIGLIAGCASLAEVKTPYQPNQDKFADLVESAGRLEQRRLEAKASLSAVPSYLDAGVSLSNVACEIWFTELARAEREAALTKDLMNVVGNFILGVSGINGANPTSLGRGALGLSAANTAFDVYRADILLGSIEDIRAKIRDDRTVAENALMARTDITYDAAMRRLLEYHHLCSVERIKVLLSKSLAAVKFEHPDTTLASPIDKAKATALTSSLRAHLGRVDALVQDQDLLYQTYLALVVYPAADASDPDFVKNARKNQVVTIFTGRFAPLSQVDKESVVTTLQEVAVLLRFGERLKADIAAVAGEKQVEAKRAVDTAIASLVPQLKALSKDMDVRKALGVPDSVNTEDQFVAQVRSADPAKIRNQLNTLAAATSRADLSKILYEMQELKDAEARLSLAAATADRARRTVAPPAGVTPNIVPVSK